MDCYEYMTNNFTSSTRLYSKSYNMFSTRQDESVSEKDRTGGMSVSGLAVVVNLAHTGLGSEAGRNLVRSPTELPSPSDLHFAQKGNSQP